MARNDLMLMAAVMMMAGFGDGVPSLFGTRSRIRPAKKMVRKDGKAKRLAKKAARMATKIGS